MTALPPILLHAPTLDALARARNSFMNCQIAAPGRTLRIVANAHAVAAALDMPNEQTDAHTYLCAYTLQNLQRSVRAPLHMLPGPAILEIAQLQAQGWVYIRA